MQRAMTIFAALYAAGIGCAPARGHDGEPCTPPPASGGLDSAPTCDDGLVCIGTIASGTCGPCSTTDPKALCDLLHACVNGACLVCPGGPDDCGLGAYGRSCVDGGACDGTLVCSPGGICLPPDAEKPPQNDQ